MFAQIMRRRDEFTGRDQSGSQPVFRRWNEQGNQAAAIGDFDGFTRSNSRQIAAGVLT